MRFQDTEEFSKQLEEPWLKVLREQFNIRHVEQFAALVADPTGRIALQDLGVPVDDVELITDRAINRVWGVSLSDPLKPGESQEGKRVTLLTNEWLPLGLDAGRKDPFRNVVFGSELPRLAAGTGRAGQKGRSQGWFPETPQALPSEFFVLRQKKFPAARDQIKRGTCVAFTVTAMWEVMSRFWGIEPIQLAPQFLFYWAKKEDGSERADGTSLPIGLEMLKQYGACSDNHCEYVGHHDFGQCYMYDHEPDADSFKEAKANALKHRINKFSAIEATAVEALKRTLASGRPVGIGVPIFKSAWTGGYTFLKGEVQMPLTRQERSQEQLLDERLGSHAICVVGYRDNDPSRPESHRPGGGYFAFRNSWGTDWGRSPDKPLAPGYGVLPYAYVQKYCLDARAVDNIILENKIVRWPGLRPSEGNARTSKARKSGRGHT